MLIDDFGNRLYISERCPYCGSLGYWSIWRTHLESESIKWYVECENCGGKTPLRDTINDAVREWNEAEVINYDDM